MTFYDLIGQVDNRCRRVLKIVIHDNHDIAAGEI
jgi:hypothetical protein